MKSGGDKKEEDDKKEGCHQEEDNKEDNEKESNPQKEVRGSMAAKWGDALLSVFKLERVSPPTFSLNYSVLRSLALTVTLPLSTF